MSRRTSGERRGRFIRWLAPGAYLVSVLVLTTAQAEDAGTHAPNAASTETPAAAPSLSSEYLQAIDLALLEFDRGNFVESREHMRKAHELAPSARTLRGLGKVEFELRNYGECVRYLEEALASTERPLDPPLREEVEALLERARAYVGEVHVDVQPGTATVSVDGVPVAQGPSASLQLVVGDHVLEFHASGRMPARRAIRVRGREAVHLQIALAAPEQTRSVSAPTPIDPLARERTTAQPLYRKWWLWTGVAVVAGGVATAVLATRGRETRERSYAAGTSGITLESR